jgi:hypothetical protein
MHECNGVAKFRPAPPMTRALCLSSQSAPFNMRSTYRKCGADEGQMRGLIGYLVAGRGHRAGDGTNGRRHSLSIPVRDVPVQGISDAQRRLHLPEHCGRQHPRHDRESSARQYQDKHSHHEYLCRRVVLAPCDRSDRKRDSALWRVRLRAPEQCQATGRGARRN